MISKMVHSKLDILRTHTNVERINIRMLQKCCNISQRNFTRLRFLSAFLCVYFVCLILGRMAIWCVRIHWMQKIAAWGGICNIRFLMVILDLPYNWHSKTDDIFSFKLFFFLLLFSLCVGSKQYNGKKFKWYEWHHDLSMWLKSSGWLLIKAFWLHSFLMCARKLNECAPFSAVPRTFIIVFWVTYNLNGKRETWVRWFYEESLLGKQSYQNECIHWMEYLISVYLNADCLPKTYFRADKNRELIIFIIAFKIKIIFFFHFSVLLLFWVVRNPIFVLFNIVTINGCRKLRFSDYITWP